MITKGDKKIMKTFDIVNILQDIKATKTQVVDNAKSVGKTINLGGDYKKTKEDEINIDHDRDIDDSMDMLRGLLGS